MRSVTEEQRSQRPAQTLARRVAGLCRCSDVARRSKIHKGYSPSSRLAPAPNLPQRTRSLFCEMGSMLSKLFRVQQAHWPWRFACPQCSVPNHQARDS
jgi:hypothetical protein